MVPGVYFNKFHGIPFARYAADFGAGLMVLTFVVLRDKFVRAFSAIVLSSLAGLTLGGGLGLTGVWFIFQNPSKVFVGLKWLIIGTIFLVAFIFAFKALVTEPEKQLVSDEEIQQMTSLEQLKHLEKSLNDEETFTPIKKGPTVALGFAFMLVGILMVIPAIAKAESPNERWIMISILLVVMAGGVWFVVWMRRKTVGQFNMIMTNIDGHRKEMLTKIRAEIAKLEASADDEPSSPAETN